MIGIGARLDLSRGEPAGTSGFRFYKFLLPLLGFVALLNGCGATVNWDYPRVASYTLEHPETTIGRFFKDATDHHPGFSGFSVIQEGRDAFIARLALVDLAEKTLDVQYYIWDADVTGRLLAQRLLRAADRGVRVRVLIDDNYQTEQKDFTMAALSAHPNMEIRVFNPVDDRYWRTLSFLGEFSRDNHRMHNKLFVVDNAMGIVGGRNIADVYFGVRADHNYRDLDIATAGPIVKDLSASFDMFWNSDWAIPIAATVDESPTEQDLRVVRNRLKENIAAAQEVYPIDEDIAELRAHVAQIRDNFVWAPGKVLVEKPSRVDTDADPSTSTGVIADVLVERLTTVKKEVLVESPYFVPRERGVKLVELLKARGVKIQILTNSAASNDVLAVHAGYAKNREKLLRAGVELYELRPDTDMKRRWSVLSGKSRAALHAKVMVFDRESVFIGSFNLDPRSLAVNTEIGVLIDSPKIAAQVGKWMDEGISPGSAFHVTLDENGDLVWIAENNGKEVKYDSDPETSLWLRFFCDFLGFLPIDSLL